MSKGYLGRRTGLPPVRVFGILLFAMLFIFACGKKAEITDPDLDAGLEGPWSTDEEAGESLEAIYWMLREHSFISGHYSKGPAVNMGLYADELTYRSQPTGLPEYLLYVNHLHDGMQFLVDHMSGCLPFISRVNTLVGPNAEDFSGLSPKIRERVMGVAYFIRGFAFFNLTNTYGDFPYYTEPLGPPMSPIQKSPVSEVYGLVLADLKKALTHIGDDASETRTAPDSWAVRALMARLYLYQEDWENAVLFSSQLIDADRFLLEPDIDRVFLKASRETIWHLAPGREGENTLEGKAVAEMENSAFTNLSLSDELLAGFEQDDLRKEKWVRKGVTGNSALWYPDKYKEAAGTGNESREYSVVLRLAEQYLIRAEAYAHLGRIEEALTDLNRIRHRANLDPLTLTDQAEVLDAILRERRVELFLEFGHRFYDIKRAGRAAEFLKPIKQHWNDNHLVWPLPFDVVDGLPGMAPQNPGY